MAKITVKGSNVSRLLVATVENKVNAVRKEVVRRASQGGVEISNAVKDVMTGQGKGKWYGNHQASAPGDPPAVASGHLRNSFKPNNNVLEHGSKTVIKSWASSNLTNVSPGYNYAWIDKGNSRVAPRPYVKKTQDKAKEVLIKSLKRPYHV